MEVVAFFAICVVGTLFPLLNPEVAAVGLATTRGWSPALVGVVAAAGQCFTYTVVYVGGAALVERWKFLHRLVDRVRVRFADHLERRFLGLAVVGGLVGLPPLVPLSALANGLGVPLHHLLGVAIVTRTVRFTLLAAFANEAKAWLGLG